MVITTAFSGLVPENYDKYLGPVLFEPYAVDLTDRLKSDTLHQVLEIACGTGRVTNHLVKVLAKDGLLIATDLNTGMLEIAKEKITDNKIRWQVANAEELPFDDAAFDHVICQFGVMFFPDKLKAFREVYRVLQPGGTFLFNTWDDLKHNPTSLLVQEVMAEVFKETVPEFMERVPHSFYNQDEIKQWLQEAGFDTINLEIVSKTSSCVNLEYLINGFLNGTPLSVFLKQQPDDLQAAVWQQLKERIMSRSENGHMEVQMQAIVCQALRRK